MNYKDTIKEFSGLSRRTVNCLYYAGITTKQQLKEFVRRPHREMLKLRNFGKVCLDEVLRYAAYYGWTTCMDQKPNKCLVFVILEHHELDDCPRELQQIFGNRFYSTKSEADCVAEALNEAYSEDNDVRYTVQALHK